MSLEQTIKAALRGDARIVVSREEATIYLPSTYAVHSSNSIEIASNKTPQALSELANYLNEGKIQIDDQGLNYTTSRQAIEFITGALVLNIKKFGIQQVSTAKAVPTANHFENYSPSRVFNTNIYSYWWGPRLQRKNLNFTVDFGSEQRISGIEMGAPGGQNNRNSAPRDFQVQASQDAQSWDVVAEVKGQSWTSDQQKLRVEFVERFARYWRIYIINNAGNSFFTGMSWLGFLQIDQES